MQRTTQINITGICGSLRTGSHTMRALKVAMEGARLSGAETTIVDLNDYDLAFCNGNVNEEEAYPKDVFRLRKDVIKADGIILASPEYHGSFSGVLKNALDLMGFDEFQGKMIGLVGVSAGKMGALNALNGLRTVGRHIHAWVIPEQVSIAEAWKQFDEEGRVKDPDLRNRLLNVGRQVARFAYLHSSDEAQEFIRLWEEAPENPGGE